MYKNPEDRKKNQKQYYQDHKEENSVRCKDYYQKNTIEILKQKKEYHKIHPTTKRYESIRRLEAIAYYSDNKNECACCGEKNIEFLGINHINGGGSKHRKEIGCIYQWLKKNNYPKGFNILCHNCNMAKGFYGYCPHEFWNLVKEAGVIMGL